MTTIRTYDFETPRPVVLFVELGRGSLTIVATDTTATGVEVRGKDVGEVSVEQHGDRIDIVAPRPRTGFFVTESGFDVIVSLPGGSDLAARTGSAGIAVEGVLGSCETKTGSGDVHLDTLEGPSLIETGSGDVEVGTVGAELRVKSGSGQVTVHHVEGAVAASTGSGDVEIGTSNAPVAVKTGSGDFSVHDAGDDISLATGSGDLIVRTARRGKFTVKGASGDIQIGVPADTPVWTDLSTISGSIDSDLVGAGQPAEGQDHLELRATTVSGDIVLTQL